MTIVASPSSRAGGASPPGTSGSGGMGGPWAIVFVIVVFGIIAAIVFVNNGNPEIRRIDLIAQQYADAWANGGLNDLEYDKLSGPGVKDGDAEQVDNNVRHIVHDLDGKGKLRPKHVTVQRDATHFTDDARTLAQTQLKVTWELQLAGLSQRGHVWTYVVNLVERLYDGRWRVVWNPQTVHPDIRPGMAFRVTRTLAARAPLIGAGDTALPPDSNRNLAHAVLGSIATKATEQQADLGYLRAEPGDTVGVAGLQDIYDQRLAGGARITVTAGVLQGSRGITPPATPLFVGAPETPTPIQLTLDARTQGWAESALRGVNAPATVVVAKPSTGEVLAVANNSSSTDLGLSSQQPPGPIFGLTSYLAMLRKDYSSTSPVDCREPFTFPGEGQMFRNSEGPTIAQVRLAAAIEGGCTTALARLSTTVSPVELQEAAWDLGITTPLSTQAQTPGWLAVADQLGTPAYLGRVTSDSATDLGTDDDKDGTRAVSAVRNAQNMVGEGKVLVSPLSVTRATVTVATGRRKALRLITNPAPAKADIEKPLEADAVRDLQEVMAKGVTEGGGSAHALAGLPGSPVYAIASTAGYGTGRTDVRAAWVTGYRGDYAFTILIPNVRVTDGTRAALEIARRFVLNIP